MRGEDTTMMLNMTEADYESWRDDLRCRSYVENSIKSVEVKEA